MGFEETDLTLLLGGLVLLALGSWFESELLRRLKLGLLDSLAVFNESKYSCWEAASTWVRTSASHCASFQSSKPAK